MKLQLKNLWNKQLFCSRALSILFVCFFSFISTVNGQTIQISKTVLTIEEVFSEIQRQTKMSIDYDKALIPTNQTVNLVKGNSSLDEVLKATLKSSGCTYTIKNNHIMLSKNNVSKDKATVTITGVIKDDSDEPLIGASVTEQGTTNGTITDFDGRYNLTVNKNSTLRVSYIGYLTKDIKTGNQTTINITLLDDSKMLDEVVVVGYGIQKKRDLTGAISSVKMDEMPVQSVSTVSHALAGKAAGLQVNQTSAQVGGGAKFRIRGSGSLNASNEPLIIIDGFPVSSSSNQGSGNRYDQGSYDNVLESLNPNDIESIEVLKDASSTAIYGSRAGNGVIIVTTKRGSTRKPAVTYSGNLSVQKMKNSYDMLDSKDFMNQRNRYAREMYLISQARDIYKDYKNPAASDPGFKPLYSDEEMLNPLYTDWFNHITRTGIQHSHNISLSGGSESTQYMASLNYFNQEGVIKNNNMDRYTMKLNLDQIINKYVKIGISLNISRNKYDNVPLGEKEHENAGIITSAILFNPTLPVYDENGDYMIDPQHSQVPNPLSLLDISDKTTKDRLLTSGYVQYEPIKELALRASVGFDRKYGKRSTYLPTTTLVGQATNGQAHISQSDDLDYLMELTATYKKNFLKDHDITALMGYSYQRFGSEGLNGGNQDFLSDVFGFNNLGAGSYPRPIVGSYKNRNALGSYFGRLNYSYKGRYLMTATLRADGATNFAKDNRWGYFPSVSLGWIFTDEKFMAATSKVLSNGKLRLSYGQTGNSSIGDKLATKFYMGQNNVLGDSGVSGVYTGILGNPDLTWETTKEFNIGLDLGFFNNRITLAAEYFERTISDLLQSKRLPSYNELTQIYGNIGETRSNGFEITLNTVNFDNQNFEWNTDITLSQYNDKWNKRDPEWISSVYQSTKDPLRAMYGYLSDGLLQAGEKAPAHQPNLLPGQVKLKDLNGDNKIDDQDIVLLGKADNPSLIFGFNNTLRYKQFDFNIYMYGELGRYMTGSYYDNWASSGRFLNDGYNVSKGFLNAWSHDNQDTNVPSFVTSEYSTGNYNHQKVNYLRCRNITVGYSFPKNKVFNRLRVYADVNNPFVLTNWNGLDPETDSHSYSYPNVFSFNFGIDLTF